jgi:NitT/TauT family transport system substrate-binding protein
MRAACGIGLALLAVCPAQAQKAWRHGIIEAKSDAGFMWMASQRGFADKRGVKIDILQIKSDTIGLKALLAGELDSYEGGPGGVLVASARGADLKILGCHWPTLVHGLFVRGDIAKVADLKGKNLAISAPGAMPDLFVRAVLEANGVAPSEVKFANMGSDTDRYKALTVGVVDAAVVSTEYLPIAPAHIKMMFAARDVLPNFMRVCVVTSGRVLNERREDAVRFVAATIEALRHAVAHRDEAIALTREITKVRADDPRPGFIFDEVVRHRDIDPDMGIPVAKIEWMQQALLKTGNLPKAIDVARVYDAGVRTKALELLGQR